MPATTLSPTQQQALTYAREHGGRLIRLPGGFWTYAGAPTETRDGYIAPVGYYVRTTTIKALLARGELVATEHRTSRAISGGPAPYPVAVEVRS